MKHERKIVTRHVFPPIPIRSFDWCAYYDGDEELGPRGWGYTEEMAVADLKDNYVNVQDEFEAGNAAWAAAFLK